jgi:hypothetical protein
MISVRRRNSTGRRVLNRGRGSTITRIALPAVCLCGYPGGELVVVSGTCEVNLPDAELSAAYAQAARANVLPAVNHAGFFGHWCVCADGVDFGRDATYPSLDGHQMTDALLALGQVDVVKANWDYVRSFQRPNGHLPIAILPGSEGKLIGPPQCQARVDENGGLYRHWVPGDPLRALGATTYIQNADAIFRHTQDVAWLASQIESVNLAAEFLAGLTSAEGAVGGAGYYVERPVRLEWDGVTQCHAADAFARLAALNRRAGRERDAARHDELAGRITRHFRSRFWLGSQFAEYIHPARGPVASHGLTDVDWSAIATSAASADQQAALWPRLKDERAFYYGGMPTGIATRPESYEDWEFSFTDHHDVAAMGRVWYIECWARARMGDADGLMDSILRVCRAGREAGYAWRERYHPDGAGGCRPAGARRYCEYPANLIRVVHRFLLGVEYGLDGILRLSPVAPRGFWNDGFGQTLVWRGQMLSYRMEHGWMYGSKRGGASQRLAVRLGEGAATAAVNGRPAACSRERDFVCLDLPPGDCRFEIRVPRPGGR